MALASSVKIVIGGKELPDFIDFQLDQSIYNHHSFTINCHLFTHEDVNSFMMEKSKEYIGADITITIEDESNGQIGAMPGLFFKGVVTELNASRSDSSDKDYLVIRGFSPDILLNESPKTCSFENKSLKQIVDDTLKPYPRNIIKSKVSPRNSGALAYIVQYDESNYTFLERMANRFGEWFFYDGEELCFGDPKKQTVDLTLGIDLMDFDFSMKLAPLQFEWIAHDYMKNESVKESSRANASHEYTKHAVDHSGKRFSSKHSSFFDGISIGEYSTVPKVLRKSLETKTESQVNALTFGSGNSTNVMIRVGKKLNIKALNSESKKEINYGSYIVTSVKHHCDEVRSYSNSFTVLPVDAAIPDTANPGAIPYCKTQTAIVTDNVKDPDIMGRVKVRFWWQESGQATPWLRVISPHAGGKEHGIYMLPEIDDEVLVGFEGDNAERPYIIGSLYNGKLLPDQEWVNDENDIKIIKTKSGNTIRIVDTAKKEEISLFLAGEDDDKSSGMISMVGKGKDAKMKIVTSGELTIKAKSMVMDIEESISMTSAKQGITMEAKKGKLNSDAMEVTTKGKTKIAMETVQFSAKGSGTMDIEGAKVGVKGSAMTEIKGGLVKIN